MLIGYARISTYDQSLSPQKDALEEAGCEKIFTDTVSGTKATRKGLEEAFSHLRACLVRVRVEPFWRCGVRRGPI
jgi:DNA invertase Pin-like site-specific DNA recombinase